MRELVIVGAGGHGRETLDIVEAVNAVAPTWAFRGFVDDGPSSAERIERRGAVLLGAVDHLRSHPTCYVLGIGASQTRARLDERLSGWGAEAVTLVHPHATLGADNRIGEGVLVAAGARVTTNVTLGRHVHLNVNAVVSHDCSVGDHATLSPGAHVNGEVTLGRRTFLGTGAIVLPGVVVGDDACVGAGAVVTRDVAPRAVVRGVPAR